MKTMILFGSFLALSINVALAQQERNSGPAPKLTATAKLLQQQRSGNNASQEEQYLDGKVRANIYTRYVESFTHGIPERFTEDSFTSED